MRLRTIPTLAARRTYLRAASKLGIKNGDTMSEQVKRMGRRALDLAGIAALVTALTSAYGNFKGEDKNKRMQKSIYNIHSERLAVIEYRLDRIDQALQIPPATERAAVPVPASDEDLAVVKSAKPVPVYDHPLADVEVEADADDIAEVGEVAPLVASPKPMRAPSFDAVQRVVEGGGVFEPAKE